MQVGPFSVADEKLLFTKQLIYLDYKVLVQEYEFLVHKVNKGDFPNLPTGTHAFFVEDGHRHVRHGIIEFTRRVYMTVPGNYSYSPKKPGGEQ